MSELDHIVAKVREAAHGGFGVLSTGEKLTAAIVLNRPDWLAGMGYSIVEAIDRIGPEWMRLIPVAARMLVDEQEELDAGREDTSADAKSWATRAIAASGPLERAQYKAQQTIGDLFEDRKRAVIVDALRALYAQRVAEWTAACDKAIRDREDAPSRALYDLDLIAEMAQQFRGTVE